MRGLSVSLVVLALVAVAVPLYADRIWGKSGAVACHSLTDAELIMRTAIRQERLDPQTLTELIVENRCTTLDPFTEIKTLGFVDGLVNEERATVKHNNFRVFRVPGLQGVWYVWFGLTEGGEISEGGAPAKPSTGFSEKEANKQQTHRTPNELEPNRTYRLKAGAIVCHSMEWLELGDKYLKAHNHQALEEMYKKAECVPIINDNTEIVLLKDNGFNLFVSPPDGSLLGFTLRKFIMK